MKRFLERLASLLFNSKKRAGESRLKRRARFYRPWGKPLEGRSLLATLSIGPVTIDEEDGTFSYPVTLTGSAGGAFTIDWGTISGGTASAGFDYTTASGTLSFAGTNGEVQHANVSVINDTIVEPTETVNTRLNGASLAGPAAANVTVGTSTANGYIVNTDRASFVFRSTFFSKVHIHGYTSVYFGDFRGIPGCLPVARSSR